jgi:GPH family glycoside/pentoside/hexuronide:cation symporter
MLVAAMSFLLMIFYTDVALVPPAIAGAALLVGKFWDAVNDPLLGWMSDRIRSRHGRHRVTTCCTVRCHCPGGGCGLDGAPGLSPLAAFVWIALTYTLF